MTCHDEHVFFLRFWIDLHSKDEYSSLCVYVCVCVCVCVRVVCCLVSFSTDLLGVDFKWSGITWIVENPLGTATGSWAMFWRIRALWSHCVLAAGDGLSSPRRLRSPFYKSDKESGRILENLEESCRVWKQNLREAKILNNLEESQIFLETLEWSWRLLNDHAEGRI